jgi:hypothetical protein
MVTAVRRYFDTLFAELGTCWNRFWFQPSDRAPLDVLRVAVGLISLYLLATLTPDLDLYFADRGLLSIDTVNQLEAYSRGFSYFDYLHSHTELLTAHIAGIVIVALFTVGLFTSVTSLLSLVVMLSTVNRAPVLTTLVEPVVTMVLFYLCLGPAGPFAAIARLITGRPIERVSTWATVSLRLLQVHLALLYATMALSKLYSAAWWSGMGVWWLMSRPESRLVDLTGLATTSTYWINLWTHLIVAFELAFAILIWNRLARPLLLAWSVVHWLGIAILLGQPPLAATMIAVNAAFVSPDVLRAWLPRRAPQALPVEA